MKPGLYVKANGTICMSYDVFRAADHHDIVKVLATGRRVTAAHRDLREQRTLTVNTFVGNARNTSNAQCQVPDLDYTTEPDQAWIDEGWEDDTWHPMGVDVWDYIAEVLGDALDYLFDAGYLG